MRLPVLDRLILGAQKPSRYAGGELNAVHKRLDQVALKWALAFPDTYEVGMSNVGFRLLYHALNERPDVACERFFMPWPDLEAALRAERLPLFSIESRAPLSAFDVLGLTLQFELCYTTVLAMLDLGGIPLLSADRRREDPLVLGGGPCAYNPEPVADFFDAFVVGEGEEVIHEISDVLLDWKRSRGSRRDLLWHLAEIPGVYVPSLFRPRYHPDKTIAACEPLKPGYEAIVRRVIPDLNLVPQAEKPIVPFMQTVHDRLPLEIQRGCTRGCRFCQVGMITRPTRQRDPNQVRRIAEAGLQATGYEEVGFLSLSAGDYSCINGVLEDFFDEFGPENVGISLPSLRTETMNARLAEQIGRVRKSGFTVAPEAATERMRRVINKGNAEKDLLHAVDTIFEAGWDLVKFYFMIGLPTERDEDVRAIVHLCAEALRRGKRLRPRGEINVGVSTFCPKPFTPFQWDPMIPLEETRRKQGLLRDELRKLGRGYRDLHVKPHDARQGALEGALALGDRRLATAVLHAYRNGQRLDGWTEHFKLDVWQGAFARAEAEHGVGLAFFAHREKGKDEVLPFDHIDCEVTKPYLWKERVASLAEGATHDGGLRLRRRALHRLRQLRLRGGRHDRLPPRGLPAAASAPASADARRPQHAAGPLREGRTRRRAQPPGDDDRPVARVPPRRAAHSTLAGVPSQAARQLRACLPGRDREPGGVPRPGAARCAGPGAGGGAHPAGAAGGPSPALLRAAAGRRRVAQPHHPRHRIPRRAGRRGSRRRRTAALVHGPARGVGGAGARGQGASAHRPQGRGGRPARRRPWRIAFHPAGRRDVRHRAPR